MSIQIEKLNPFIVQSSTLQQIDPLPTKEQAKKTFWGLGDRFWMQIIDGKYHKYGPMVFDKGLHGGDIEPGFFESLKTGCEFASEHLTEKLTVQFYKDLHKKLCSHFKGKETNTVMSSDEAGVFRDQLVTCKRSIKNFSEESQEHYFFVEIYRRTISERPKLSEAEMNEKYQKCCEDWFIENYDSRTFTVQWMDNWKLELEKEKNISQKISNQHPISKKWVTEWELNWNNKTENINNHISEFCKSINKWKFAYVFINFHNIYVDYQCSYPEKHEEITQILFDRYNQKIEEINLKIRNAYTTEIKKQLLEEKVEAIADLFQLLEWLHPFIDGQGRTDLVLLAKLLSEEGLNPPILNEPYTSTWSLLSEWKNDLLKGIESWKAN